MKRISTIAVLLIGLLFGSFAFGQTNINVPQLSVPYRAVTASTTALKTDVIIGYTALNTSKTVTIPPAKGLAGKLYIIRNESTVATTTIWLTVSGTGTIDGSTASVAVVGLAGTTQTDGVIKIYSNGSNWYTW